jgi:hypothetical protein
MNYLNDCDYNYVHVRDDYDFLLSYVLRNYLNGGCNYVHDRDDGGFPLIYFLRNDHACACVCVNYLNDHDDYLILHQNFH